MWVLRIKRISILGQLLHCRQFFCVLILCHVWDSDSFGPLWISLGGLTGGCSQKVSNHQMFIQDSVLWRKERERKKKRTKSKGKKRIKSIQSTIRWGKNPKKKKNYHTRNNSFHLLFLILTSSTYYSNVSQWIFALLWPTHSFVKIYAV